MPNYSFCLECIKGDICSTDSENDSVSGFFRPQVSLVSLSRHSALEEKKKCLQGISLELFKPAP